MLSQGNGKDYSKVYKAYDIRGIYNDPIDEVFAYNIGLGLGKEACRRDGENAKILIGSDVRENNNRLIYWIVVGLKESGVQSITSAGLKVDALDNQKQIWGVCSTSMMYYFTKGSFTFGIPVTASHNPPEYVGMKIVDRESMLVDTSIIKSYIGNDYKPLPYEFDQNKCSTYIDELLHHNIEKDMLEEKYNKLLTLIESHFQQLKVSSTIVVDYVNAASIAYERRILQYICKKYNHALIELNSLADSQFRAHFSDTTNDRDYQQLQQAVKEHKADIGFMFDGDADRMGVVDEKGEIIAGDILVATLAEYYLKQSSEGSAVVYDITSSRCIVDIINKYKGTAIVSRVGHRFVKEKYKESNAVFAGELSGHLFFKEVGGFECTIMSLALLLTQREHYQSASNIAKQIMHYYKPTLINFRVEEVMTVLEKIKNHFKDHNQEYLDGVRVNGEGRRFLVRGSNTEPIIRFYAEALDKDSYEKIRQEVEAIINGEKI